MIFPTIKILLFFSLIISSLFAEEATPFDQELLAGQVQRITAHEPIGEIPTIQTFNAKNNAARRKGFHYKLYLPKEYHDNPKKRYPVMFTQSSGGNANFFAAKARYQNHNWIVAMLVEASNKEQDSLNCFLAVHDDVTRRCRVAKGLKVVTGTSGGARNSSLYALLRPGINAVFFQAAGFVWGLEKEITWKLPSEYPQNIILAGCFGDRDYNRGEIPQMARQIKDKSRFKSFCFKGRHSPTSTKTSDIALDWIEEQLFFNEPKPFEKSELFNKYFPLHSYEAPDKYSYYWYFTSLRARIDQTEDPYKKYLFCRKLAKLSKRPELRRSSATKRIMAEVNRIASLAKKDKKVKRENKIKKQWLKVQTQEETTQAVLTQSYQDGKVQTNKATLTSVPSFTFDAETKQALMDYKELAHKFIKTFPKSYYSQIAKDRLESWGYEYDLHDMFYTENN